MRPPSLKNKYGVCPKCETLGTLTRDHIVPRWLFDNLKFFGIQISEKERQDNGQYICQPCNSRKGGTIDYGSMFVSDMMERLASSIRIDNKNKSPSNMPIVNVKEKLQDDILNRIEEQQLEDLQRECRYLGFRINIGYVSWWHRFSKKYRIAHDIAQQKVKDVWWSSGAEEYARMVHELNKSDE